MLSACGLFEFIGYKRFFGLSHHKSKRAKEPAVGFPPPLLGDAPVRLPVLMRGDGWIALEKPVGVLIEAHPWYPRLPSLIGGLRKQLEAGKAELERLALKRAYGIYFLDPEIIGPALIATQLDMRDGLRNAHGSGQIIFRYVFFALNAPAKTDLQCDLPLAELKGEARMRVSHRHGKKASTVFRRIGHWSDLSEWEAVTCYPRPHQVRLHAMESGLRILGESIYGELDTAYKPSKFRRYIPDTLCLRLASVEFKADEAEGYIEVPEAGSWRALRRQLPQKRSLQGNGS